MKRMFSVTMLAALAFAIALSGYSQSSAPQGGKDRNPQTSTTPQTPQTNTDRTAKTTDKNSHTDKNTTAQAANAGPVGKAIEMNVAEVEAGKLASSKAENPRVKEFADMMVKDHTDALNKLRSVPGAPADVKPNAKHQQTADRLSKLSGAAFDREYMRTMVSDHQEALRFLEQQGGRAKSGAANPPAGKAAANPSDFASVAQELVPTVRQHLQKAQEVQKELQGGTKSTKQSSNTDSTNAPGRSKSSTDATQK